MNRRLPFALLALGLFACGGGDGTAATTDATSTDDAGVDSAAADTSATDSGTTADGATDTGVDAAKDAPADAPPAHVIQTVWVIVEENHNWSSIKGSAEAPYINKTLLPMGAHAEQYYNPPGLHPSEPNYLWMEAGDNLGVTDDKDPASNHQATKDHLVTYLDKVGVTWGSFQENIPDKTKCPLVSAGTYGAKHNPMVFFDDVTDTNKATSAYCLAHVHDYSAFAPLLGSGKLPRYNFLTPDVCNDMHGATGCATGTIKRGDDWLAAEIPKILASPEYKAGGAIFLTWDEGAGTSDGPIGMIVISPFAKKGYSNTVKYTHSSLLRTLQTIFDAKPFLRDAAKATDLSDLFTSFP